MHFLGAVITERKEDLEETLAPWSEYNDVPEHIVRTRDEFLKENREDDMRLIDHEHENQPDSESETAREAERRLALPDDKALRAYAEWSGATLDGDGNEVSTFNEESFYDYWEPADEAGWKTPDGTPYGELQGRTCKEILDRCPGALDDVCIVVADGDHIGGYGECATSEDIEREFRAHPACKVWWVDFHE